MTNTANFASITGRLVRTPKIFRQEDGSRLVKATIAVQDNFKSGPDKKRQCQFVDVEHPLAPWMGAGPWADACKGVKIQVMGHIRPCKSKKDGKVGYGGIMVVVDNMNYLESKAQVAARRAVQAAAEHSPCAG